MQLRVNHGRIKHRVKKENKTMITASEYRLKQTELLNEYEERVRKWLKDKGENQIAEKIPFFRDGVTNPEVWFAPGNNFRPLFVLKDVSLGVDKVSDVDQFLKTWGNQKQFDFVENPFDDVKIGKFILWRKIAALTKGLEDIYLEKGFSDYGKYDFSYQTGGMQYTGDIEGYKDYGFRTSNPLYNDMIEKIAVLEVKKIGGGRDVNSELSIATRHYAEHIAPFRDLICREIELINPTLIICCSREYFTQNLLEEVKNNTSERLWIYGCHPTFNSTKNFYEAPVLTYKQHMESFNVSLR